MTPDRIQAILNSFAGKRVLVIGDAVIDHYVHGVVERLNPEAPVPILEVREEYDMTGGAGNVAKNLAMLGATTKLLTVLGDDEDVAVFEQAAKREGYEATAVRDGSRPTIRKTRFMVGSQQMLRVDYEKNHNISADIEEQLIQALQPAMEGIDAVLVSDYAKGTVTEKVAQAVMQAAQERGIPVAADTKPSRTRFFKGCSLISPNRKEAHEILGYNMYEQDGHPAEKLAKELQEKMDCDVYLTLSADGVYVQTKDGTSKHLPQEHKVEVFDVSGAGDTAISVLLLSQLVGAKPAEAAELSNAAGAVVVQKVGSVGVTREEIENMLLHKHEVA